MRCAIGYGDVGVVDVDVGGGLFGVRALGVRWWLGFGDGCCSKYGLAEM